MNHLTFNKEINPSLDFFVLRDGKPIVRALPDDVLDSPIFVHFQNDNPSKFGFLDVLKRLEVEPNYLPFRSLRLYYTSDKARSEDYCKGFKAWIHHSNVFFAARVWIMITKDEGFMLHITAQEQEKGMKVDIQQGNKWMKQESIQSDPAVKKAVGIIMNSIAQFIREATSPSNFIASVVPDKSGKSVEWTRARTHYVVLSKAHPANNRDVKAGANVLVDDKCLKRQAHSRRAHARVLRSPRFRNKIGLTIRVKACWVGPNEWKQFGSIYRMTDFSSANN